MATSLQEPFFLVDSPYNNYIDSCLNFSSMATFFCHQVCGRVGEVQLYVKAKHESHYAIKLPLRRI